MSLERLLEILNKYRVNKARFANLQYQLNMVERFLRSFEKGMVDDLVSLSQELTGMPHGSGIGDPTGRLAMDIASGGESIFVKQTKEDIKEITIELKKVEAEIKPVEIIIEALGDREREVLIFKNIDGMGWNETVKKMNELHNNSYSKRTLQRLLDKAMEKAYEIVR